MTSKAHTLVLGWGNPGRGDDGLGPEFVRLVSGLDLPGVVADSDYQLQVEDAVDIARFPRVLFVDADRQGPGPFRVDRLRPRDRSLSFSTPSVAPAAVLALSRDLFATEPEAWILGIRGYEFDAFEERLSDRARRNLEEAVRAVAAALQTGGLRTFGEAIAEHESQPEQEDETCLTTNH